MTQGQAILEHLRRAPLDPLTALSSYGCFRLAARIIELRDAGYRIVTEYRTTPAGKRHAVYRLAE